jgi:DNA-3-methyladenine glycosylase
MLILCELDGLLVVARIVETEAYAADIDQASHSYRGQTQRNAVMFGPAGHAYIYRSYGIHHMFNVVTTMPGGAASAVLIRGADVLQGHAALQARRPAAAVGALLSGPGNLGAGLELGPALNGHLLSLPPLRLAEGWPATEPVVTTTRIGITRSAELPWRFYLLGSLGVSRRDRAAEAGLPVRSGPCP